jgi:hypothetical protein
VDGFVIGPELRVFVASQIQMKNNIFDNFRGEEFVIVVFDRKSYGSGADVSAPATKSTQC